MQKLIDGKLHTRESIVAEYKNLVHYFALKLAKPHNDEYEDLVSEGFIGMFRAFDRFDNDHGVKFSTYSCHAIYGHMLRLSARSAGAYYPRRAIELAWKIVREDLQSLSVDGIATKLDEQPHHIHQALHFLYNRQLKRLDGPVEEMEKMTLGEIIGEYGDDTVLVVNDFLRSLTNRERVVVQGLILDKSQREIGEVIGISQVHVSRTLRNIRKKYIEYQG